MNQISSNLARVFRAESGQVLAALMMYTKDFDLAEDALQDACLQATEQWSERGLPDNKGAWLLTVARRRLIDRIRRHCFQNKDETLQAIYDSLPDAIEDENNHPIPDERLRLIFTCCHPSLSQEARVALTLKTLCGLSVREIARAYLTSDVTMNQRLTRVKRKIRDSGIGYQVPEGCALAQRLPSVLSVIYLIYNESYSAYEGQSLTREDLANEAIRLANVLFDLLPRSDVAGLLALLLIHNSRRAARSSDTQAFIPLENQDRSLWDYDSIRKGKKLLLTAMKTGKSDVYQIQAAISMLHAQAKSWKETDWLQIQLLYKALYVLDPSPVVALNKSVALAHAGQLKQAYNELMLLQKDLSNYQPYHAALADLAGKLGLHEYASECYSKAIELTNNTIEKSFLVSQREKCITHKSSSEEPLSLTT